VKASDWVKYVAGEVRLLVAVGFGGVAASVATAADFGIGPSVARAQCYKTFYIRNL